MTILSATPTFGDIAQWVLLVIILIIAAIWILRRLTGKKSGGCSGCDNCPLSDRCHDRDDKPNA